MSAAQGPRSKGPRVDEVRALSVPAPSSVRRERSRTDGLVELSAGIMRRRGVEVEVLRAVAYADNWRVGGRLFDGNEDGVKDCAMNVLLTASMRRQAAQPAAIISRYLFSG